MEGRWVKEAWTTDSGAGGGWPEELGKGVLREREERREDRQSGDKIAGLKRELLNKLRRIGES